MIGKWIFKQFMQFQIFMYRRSGGKRMGSLRGMPVLLLTTVGRKTGQRRFRKLVRQLRPGNRFPGGPALLRGRQGDRRSDRGHNPDLQ